MGILADIAWFAAAAAVAMNAFHASTAAAQQVTLAAQAQTNAAVFREQVGRRLTFVCPANVNINQDIYGTDVYTDTSPVCTAAAHAGVFTKGTSTAVTIVMEGRKESFTASNRNKVQSLSYGPWAGTYSFARTSQPGQIDWNTTLTQVASDYLTPITLVCPRAGPDRGEIWGTDVYPDDSAICVAGVHAGVITLEGGTLTVTRVEKQASFPSTTRHDITSKLWSDPAWRSYPQPYSVAAANGVVGTGVTPINAVLVQPSMTTGTAPPMSSPTATGTTATRTTEVTRVAATTALAPPTNLVASGTPAMATLIWQAPTTWVPTGYTVVRRIAGTTESTLLTTASITDLRYEDRSGFGAGKSYVYVVTALSADPKASGTAETRFVPPPPQNVSNLVARRSGNDVIVSWTGVAGATKYLVAGASDLMAREVPASETQVAYSGIPPGTYTWRVGARYEPGPIETPASNWPSTTISFLAPRSMVVDGFNGAGSSNLIAPRTSTLPGFLGAGGTNRPSPRIVALPGFTAVGVTTNSGPPTVTLSGFGAVGGLADIAPRLITLPGFAAIGGALTLTSRTIALPGWIARGGFIPSP